MTTDLTTTTGNELGFPTDGPDPFAARAAALGAIQGSFLKFDGNTGDYEYGPKDDVKELPPGALVVVNMTTFKSGWICWKAGEMVEEIMIPILEGEAPPETSLTDHGPYAVYKDGTKDGWQAQNGIEFRIVDNGELLIFKGTSKSAQRAFAKLLQDFAKIYRQKPKQLPVVELGNASFEPKLKEEDGQPAKKIGKKYAPTMKIVSWMPTDEYEALIKNASVAPAEKTEGEDDPSNYADATTSTESGETTEAGAGRRARRL